MDVAVIDLRLPDMLGTEVVLELQAHGRGLPFVLVSAFLTTETTVKAMNLGAHTVLEKPIAADHLCATVLAAVLKPEARVRSDPEHPATQTAVDPPRRPLTNRKSTAERWAAFVLQAREMAEDPKTLDDWARCAGASYSSLRESCRLLGIVPHNARDLARLLRAVSKAHVHGCGPEAFLDVADERTLRTLFERGGLEGWRHGRAVSIDEFLRRQRFVDPSHEALKVLRALVAAANAA